MSAITPSTSSPLSLSLSSPPPQDQKGGNSYPQQDEHHNETIESLEQALKIQITKRIELQMQLLEKEEELKSHTIRTPTSIHNNNTNNNSKNGAMMVLNNVYQKVKDLIIHTTTNNNNNNENNENDENNNDTSMNSISNDNDIQSLLVDFIQLFNEFIFELESIDENNNNVDDDENNNNDHDNHKDIIWFLKHELQWRLYDIHDKSKEEHENITIFMNNLIDILKCERDKVYNNDDDTCNGTSVDDNHDDDDDDHEYDHEHEQCNGNSNTSIIRIDSNMINNEMIVSKLEGRIAQLEEDKDLLIKQHQQHQQQHQQPPLQTQTQTEYQSLLQKYKHLETRHRNVLHEMQSSIATKNEELHNIIQSVDEQNSIIDQLKNDILGKNEQYAKIEYEKLQLEDQIEELISQVQQMHLSQEKTFTHDEPSLGHQEKEGEEEGMINEVTQSLHHHEDIQINSLKEDLQERDRIIQDMKGELSNLHELIEKREASHEVDKIRLRYLEGIVCDLEQQLAKAKNKSMVKYGTIAHFDVENDDLISSPFSMSLGGIRNNIRDNVKPVPPPPPLPPILSSNQTGQHNLRQIVKDVTDRFNQSQQENERLRKELQKTKLMLHMDGRTEKLH